MISYTAYGLHIRSDIDLPGYHTLENSERPKRLPTVVIRKGDLDRSDLSKYNDNGDCLAGFADDTLLFRMNKGKTIIFDPFPGADRRFVKAVLGGELMAMLLRQRGILTIHGSCVAKRREAIAFVGESGWGKSTTATLFTQNGYSLVSDDIVAIDLGNEAPHVLPGPSHVRLQPDVGERFLENYESLPVAHDRTSKRFYTLEEDLPTSRVRLRKLYFLENKARETNAITSVSSRDAMVELMAHTRGNRVISAPDYMEGHLRRCSSLIDNLPVALLQRTFSLDKLPEIKDIVEDDIGVE